MKNPLVKESNFQNGFYYFGRNKRERIASYGEDIIKYTTPNI